MDKTIKTKGVYRYDEWHERSVRWSEFLFQLDLSRQDIITIMLEAEELLRMMEIDNMVEHLDDGCASNKEINYAASKFRPSHHVVETKV